ncbi:MAG: glycosyltransferase family 2 protein [Bacteroidales bacterium]|jgi:GT2 family glycosyltransferase|nr:glycosyltransferase family 2 protein [Bacteroidales bacterium]
MEVSLSNKTAVAILNWNGINFLKEFVPVLLKNTDKNIADIWVIDNGSTDESVSFLKNTFPEIKLVPLDKNYGFAEGYNKGLSQINAKYYLLLNSDIEVTHKWLEPLLELMENNPNIAICSPKLLDYKKRDHFEYAGAAGGYIDKYGYPFCRGRIFENIEKDMGQYDNLTECMWVSGAALMIRSELYNKVGGFDDAFFAHQEEIDLCWRLQNLGYKIVCEPKSHVFHIGGGTLEKGNPRKTYYNFRNSLFLIKKNLPQGQRRRSLFMRFFLDGIATVRMIFQGLPKDAVAVVKAYFHFWIKLGEMKKKRKLIKPKKTKYLKGFYNKSIVFQNFITKKENFRDLGI